jgi:hypothetical protein
VTVFRSYVVRPMRDLGEHCEECPAHEADFWGLYGIDANDDAYAVGDFSTKIDAEFIKDAIEAS